MRNNYFLKTIYSWAFMGLFLTAQAQDTELKRIVFIGAHNPDADIDSARAIDQILIDSLSQYLDVTFMDAKVFNDTTMNAKTMGFEGAVISESIGSGDLPNFGRRDVYPVPSIVMEAGLLDNADTKWSLMSQDGGTWGYGRNNGVSEEDLQWKIMDALHETTAPLGWVKDQVVTYSTDDPEDRGVPYKYGIASAHTIIAVGGRTAGNSDETVPYVQDQAVAVAHLPIEQIFFMNNASTYTLDDEGNNAMTQEFWDFLRQASYFMFDAYPAQPLSNTDNLIRKAINLEVYPNPASAELSIEFMAKTGMDVDISLMTLDGKTLHSKTFKGADGLNHHILDVHTFQAGIYLLKLNINGRDSFRKVVLN